MPDTLQAVRTDQALARKGRNKRLRLGLTSEPESTTEDAAEAVGTARPAGMNRAVITHRSDRIVHMYDAEGRQRPVPEGSIRVCLSEGLHLECPLCGEEHDGNDPNCCPARERVRYRRCPVCGKTIYDDRALPEAAAAEADPDMIPTSLPSTPEARTQARLDAHMVAYHEEAARRAGLMTADSARR